METDSNFGPPLPPIPEENRRRIIGRWRQALKNDDDLHERTAALFAPKD